MEVVDRNNRPLEVGDWVMFHFDDGPVDGVSPASYRTTRLSPRSTRRARCISRIHLTRKRPATS